MYYIGKMVKEQYRESDVAKKISHITFGMMSAEEMRRQAHIQVVSKSLYLPDTHQPVQYGVLDSRMGVFKSSKCSTCGLEAAYCPGHYGFVDLELPVFHPGYFKATVKVLQYICKTCSRVLLPPEQREHFLKKLHRRELAYIEKKNIYREVNEVCRKVNICLNCREYNGVVKKCGMLKIVHEKYKSAKKTSSEMTEEFLHSFDNAIQSNRDLESLIHKAQEILNPRKVLDLFEQIHEEDLPLLVMDRECGHPCDMIIQRLFVPPVCIRPTIVSEVKTGTTEDDITMSLTKIIIANESIRKYRVIGAMVYQLMENWERLQLYVALMINSEITGVPLNLRSEMPSKPIRGIVQRLKGKHGRFRENLSGKRCNYTGRTVISPDPNLRIDQVGIPLHVAKILTYRERVTNVNMAVMQQLIINGADRHPGANYHETADHTRCTYLKFGDREGLARRLQVGDTVERHLKDGDIVLFNRQPSLHKLSMQAFYTKVMPHRTFRFNECCCNPFNADFDGDEMNIHFPQTEEARAEAIVLMGSKSNIATPRSGEPLIAAIQDFITGAYLLTQKDVFFDRAHACQLATSMMTENELHTRFDLPPPAILKPCPLWTGKQIFSLVIRPNRQSGVRAYLHAKSSKDYAKGDEMCVTDSFVVIRNGELLAGKMSKATLGSGSKDNIFYSILRQFGEEETARALSRLARLSSAFIMNRGFSIGIGDVTPGPDLVHDKKRLVREGYTKCSKLITDFEAGILKPKPGCSVEMTLEHELSGTLSKIRDNAATACLTSLSKNNSPKIMVLCGSKGSNDNISQMIACVGQQVINNHRIPNGFEDRSLPHFARNSKDPAARGFVQNSFYTGMTATEFFFHTMGGREGLVDTAVKTADTGYTQRRLVKTIEDLCVQYDCTVRTSLNEVVQFVYSGDGLDPTEMEGDGKPVDFLRFMESIRSQFPCPDELPLTGDQLTKIVESLDLCVEGFDQCSDDYRQDWKNFVLNLAKLVSDSWNKYGLSSASATDSRQKVLYQLNRVTATQINHFFVECIKKYVRAKIQPGTAVGAMAAQSIGEPATQMTLKTFHFAGLASMNITQGVPRLKELINAAKSISTPIVRCVLEDSKSEEFARLVKGRIEKTLLGQVTKYFEEVYLPDDWFILVVLDLERIKLLRLEVDIHSIQNAILASKLHVKPENITIHSDAVFCVRPKAIKHGAKARHSSEYFVMQQLLEDLPKVVIKGLPSVSRAVIELKDNGDYTLAVEGNQLRDVMIMPGVVTSQVVSNNTTEVEKTLGVEAARKTIITEISETMKGHSINVDARHIMLMADVMTYKGEVIGMTRFGMAKKNESVLMLASFEKTNDHLFEAAYHGQCDPINGVSESIIVGMPMSVGTGLFKLLHKVDRDMSSACRPLLFDTPNFHIPEAMLSNTE